MSPAGSASALRSAIPGDHCCEYMTGGRVVVLGPVGRNFAAGMSGGVAYIYDPGHVFDYYCNLDMVEISLVDDKLDRKELHELVRQHYLYTGSNQARTLLDDWNRSLDDFVKVIPIKAFLTIPRKEAGYRPVHDRIQDFGEVEQTLNEGDRRQQASRCMDCGVPFCNWACPLGNRPPEWNDAVYKGDFELAYRLLNATNDFPEFTGRVCPALCEKACVLNLTMHEPTTNRENEAAITEIAWRENYVRPVSPVRNGRKVAVIGGGPAGLAAANQLNRKGYDVTVFEKNEKAGGLLRFGIPNFKLNKTVIDRRIALMEQEGIRFRYGDEVAPETLPKGFDAYVIATGTPTARDLPVPGRELKGVHFALELLS